MPKFSEIEFSEKADEAGKAFLARLKGQGFPVDDRLSKISTLFSELDPLSYSYDDSGTRILSKIKEILLSLNFSAAECVVFNNTLLSLGDDGFGDFFGSIIQNTAMPVRLPPPPTDGRPPFPPDISNIGDGLTPDLWILSDDILGEESDPEERVEGYTRYNPVKMTVVVPGLSFTMVVPTFVAVLVMANVVFAALGWDGRGNLLKAIERGFRKVRDGVKKALKKLFSW